MYLCFLSTLQHPGSMLTSLPVNCCWPVPDLCGELRVSPQALYFFQTLCSARSKWFACFVNDNNIQPLFCQHFHYDVLYFMVSAGFPLWPSIQVCQLFYYQRLLSTIPSFLNVCIFLLGHSTPRLICLMCRRKCLFKL